MLYEVSVMMGKGFGKSRVKRCSHEALLFVDRGRHF